MKGKRKINVLIISVFFPPLQHIASNRIFSFAKYLDKTKYNVYVLTLKREGKRPDIRGVNVIAEPNVCLFRRQQFSNKDSKITHTLKACYNTVINEIGVDPYSGWVKKGTETAMKLVDEKQIDVVISSSGPEAPHVIGLNVKKHYGSKIKWIADMRDEFTSNSKRLPCPWRRLQSSIRLEEEILSSCDAVTTVSKPLLESFEEKSPNNQCVFREIRNGYDFEIPVKKQPKINNKCFEILYAGSFYGDIKPDKFFKVLEELNDKVDYRFEILGANKNTIRVPATIEDKVIISDKVPHEQAITKMVEADLLLLIIPSNYRSGVYSGKIFEYLASLTPILALVPSNDVAASLIRECNAGYVTDYIHHNEIKDTFINAYEDWTKRKISTPNFEAIEANHRKNQAKILEQLIDDVVLDVTT